MIYREEKLRKDMNLHGLHVLLAEDNDLISVITKYIEVIAKGKFFDCKIKTVEQFHDAIWNNAHEFIFFDRPDFSCSENKLLYSV